MSRLTRDLHGKTTTKKPSASASATTSIAAQLLLRRGGRAAANGDSLEFFSDLRKCQPEPRVSGQIERGGASRPEDGRGKTRRRGSTDELLSTEIGKHDYDWLLTPPATPPWSPATSSSDNKDSAAAQNLLARARPASFAKSNSRLGATGREKEDATSRLARSRSAAHSSVNTPAITSSGGHLSHVRTSSAASVSSINTVSSNASSTPLASAASSPRTPVTARSAWAAGRPCRRDKAGKQDTGSVVAGQSRASSKSKPGPPAPTCSRSHATPGVTSPRSTASTSRQVPTLARRAADAVARSRLARQSSGTGSTAQASCPTTPQPRNVHRTVPSSSSNGVKTRPATADLKHAGVPAASATTQRWRQSMAPVIASARSAPTEVPTDHGSPRNSAGQKITAEKATPRRAAAAAVGTGLARTASRPKSENANAKQNDDRRRQDAKHGGAPVHRKPALQQWSSRSVRSRSRLDLTVATSEASGPVARGRSTNENRHRVATLAAAARIAGADAFPSSRYDAMLLQEDPKNLTWLRGCEDGDDGSGGGLDLVDSTLERFDVPTGLSGMAPWR